MHRFSLLTYVVPALLLSIPQAEARDFNRLLHGDYAETLTRTCSRAAAGFGPELQLLGPSVSQTAATKLTTTYNGDGTSSSTGRTLNFTNNATAAGALPVSENEFTCTGTYQVGRITASSRKFPARARFWPGPPRVKPSPKAAIASRARSAFAV
jgi:hypothetical protein